MKALLIALTVMAGLNLRSEDLGTLSFNKQDGTAIKEAKVVKVESTRVVYLTPDGGGSVALSNLPPDLQVRFGYDASKESIAAQVEQKRHIADAQTKALVQRQFAESATRKAVAATGRTIAGRVLQKLDDGLLVDCARYDIPPPPGPRLSFASGLVFLKYNPHLKTLVDNDLVWVSAFPCGEYKYTSVQNSSRVVRRYSPTLDEAILLIQEPPDLDQKSDAK